MVRRGFHPCLTSSPVVDFVAGLASVFAGSGFGAFKDKLAELTIATLSPIASETSRWLEDTAALDRVLHEGADRARAVADPIVRETERIVGFLT